MSRLSPSQTSCGEGDVRCCPQPLQTFGYSAASNIRVAAWVAPAVPVSELPGSDIFRRGPFGIQTGRAAAGRDGLGKAICGGTARHFPQDFHKDDGYTFRVRN
eukprot:scaffold81859_cov29-Prasinocladus_malaysianus.AAC.4